MNIKMKDLKIKRKSEVESDPQYENIQPGEIREVSDSEGTGFAVCIEGEPTPEKIQAALSKVLGSMKVKRFTLDKDMNPIPADEMLEKDWVRFMRKFNHIKTTQYGYYTVTTEFVGIIPVFEGKEPELFATKIERKGKQFALRKAKDMDSAALLHSTAVASCKENTVMRFPWQVVSDCIANREWV